MSADPRVQEYARRLARHLAGNRPAVAEIARSCNISVSRLRHLFRKEMGVSPRGYLQALRMKEAERLLTATFLSIKEIRWQVGLRDASHFTRDFARLFGSSPRRYREAAWALRGSVDSGNTPGDGGAQAREGVSGTGTRTQTPSVGRDPLTE